MLGIDLDLDQAKNVALIAAVVCLVGAVLAIWILQTILQKVVVALLLLLLGFAAWSQRTALQDCATTVQAAVDVLTELDPTATTLPGTSSSATTTPADPAGTVAELDTTCSFFGVDVPIP